MAQNKNPGGNSLKVLSVCWFKVLPAQYGGQKGTALFNLYLSHLVQLVGLYSKDNSIHNLPYKAIASLPASKTQFLNPLCWNKIYRVAREEKITHMVLEYPYYGIAGYLCKKLLKVKLVIHSHNVEYARFKQEGKWWWGLLYHFERWTYRNADLVLIKTETEKQHLVTTMKLTGNKIVVIPYGMERKEQGNREYAKEKIYTQYNIPSSAKLLLFGGTLDYLPNAKAVEAIYKRIAPALLDKQLEVRIIICGRNKEKAFAYLDKWSHPLVIRAGEVDDIEDYFAAADVFINPVTTATGIQTKIIDALARDLKVVCFDSFSADLPKSENMYVAAFDDWADFVQQTEIALAAPISKDESWKESYSWSTIAENTLNALMHC